MNGIIKRIGGWIAAALTTVIIGVAFQTQNVLARLNGIGADVGLADRLSMTGYDIFYLGKPYFVFIGIALAIAFLAGGLVYRLAKFGRPMIYTVAGAIAILVLLFAMKTQFFGTHIIAGARDGIGISLQMLAGALGGFVFATVSRPKDKAFMENIAG